MFYVVGYDFFRDENALNPSPLNKSNFNSIKLENGIFSHWYVTKDVQTMYDSEVPTTWEYLTIMNANFNGTLKAGNVDYLMENIDGIKIKRRKTNEYNWITLGFVSIEEFGSSLSFTLNDYLNQNNVEYEYAFVPVVEGVEGEYITNTIQSKFNGVFICDLETIYKFYTGVEYGKYERVQKIGVFEPLGRSYPVVVSNSLMNYNSGSFSGDILNNDFFETQFPADFISEGIDQTRGWFYSLLVISVFLKGVSPYKNVLVNDLLLDKEGKKMSKSKGNIVEPFTTIEKYGEKLESFDVKRFNKNIIDPIKLIFDKTVYRSTWDEIVSNEIFRQRDKANNNDIGYFQQRIFQYITNCHVPENGKEGGWDVIYKNAEGVTLPDGDVVHNVYVEMKNKHNTMNSASAGKTYIKMQNQFAGKFQFVM